MSDLPTLRPPAEVARWIAKQLREMSPPAEVLGHDLLGGAALSLEVLADRIENELLRLNTGIPDSQTAAVKLATKLKAEIIRRGGVPEV